ncbi:MAG: ribonuclease HII [Bacilli bacterium]|nr:ribonuclease HII [Bacilli bacterium]
MKNKLDNHGDMYYLEKMLWDKGYKYIAGCDEVGRGPMAGPVVCAAVVLDKNNIIDGLNDSKKLTYKRREELSKIIKENAIEYKITYIDNDEVDKINVLEASRKGMTISVNNLKNCDYVITDCMDLYDIKVPYETYIKADSKVASVAAASILAKVERDHYMEEMAKTYPHYGFEKHKGYVTKSHKDAIKKYGVCKLHRKTYAPVMEILNDKKD